MVFEKDKIEQVCVNEIRNRWFACALLNSVTGFYEGDARTDIQKGLLLMLEAQHVSLSQTEKDGVPPLTADEIFHISAYKGGISVLVDRF